jgi:endonuclease-8
VPEGDTIFRAAANLGRALTGKTITRFETAYPHLARVDEDQPFAGQTVAAVWAEGKHLLMRFSGGQTLRTHMRMNGSWHIYKRGDRWQRPSRDMRILIETAGEPAYLAVAFNVPDAELLDERALVRSPTLGRLGPDLLAESFDVAEAVRRARAKPDQAAREILLDQSVAAGAGNVYRSEVLFLARMDPERPTHTLTDAELEGLFLLARKLMKANVGAGGVAGSTSGIVTYTGLRRTTGRSDPGERLWVYGRAGRPCRRCGTAIAYRKVGPDARGLYVCPHCQSGGQGGAAGLDGG